MQVWQNQMDTRTETPGDKYGISSKKESEEFRKDVDYERYTSICREMG